MRDIGYSLQTALADIIDNSITAGARHIGIHSDTTSDTPSIAILDDGCGMTEKELLEAMRPGSVSPLARRDSRDLGRFGLGLKTASFSQCRRLTVLSRKAGSPIACARWDLDTVAEWDDWLVEIPECFDELPHSEQLVSDGTLVIWEKLDRLVSKDQKAASQSLVRQIDDATEDLELVFHRFLAGEAGIPRVRISLNGRQLAPFDPFNSRNEATEAGQKEIVQIGDHQIEIQPFTLPHHKKVSVADWQRYAGREGYLRNQGFYVYRGKRLIIHGTWFGLAKQSELTRLARVRIDMPNVLDFDWKIDVKKASASPPPQIRARLRNIIDRIGASSKRVYTSRGKRLVDDARLPVWVRVQDRNEISYRLNHDHPIFAKFSSGLTPEQQNEFRQVLELANATIPIDAIFSDASGNPEDLVSNRFEAGVLHDLVRSTIAVLIEQGTSIRDIQDMLKGTEPFRSNWTATQEIIDLFETECATDA